MDLIESGYYVDEFGNIIPVGVESDYSDLDAISEDLEEAGNLGGGVASDIERSVRFMQIQQARNGSEAKAVNTAPLSAIQGADPKFGDRAVVTAGGGPIEVVRWPGNVDEARAVTISVGINQMGSDGSYTPITGTPGNRAYAIVNYGTRNFTRSVTIDVGKGECFSFAASWVTVSVGLALDASGSSGTMDIGASLGFGGSGGSCPVTRTVYIDTPIDFYPGQSAELLVPEGARQLLPIQRTFETTPGTPPELLPAAFQVQFFDRGGNAVGTLYGGDTVYSAMTAPLPLPGDAYSFKITNFNTLVTIPSMRFVFQLGF